MSFKALLYIEQNYSFAVLRPLQAELRARGGDARWFLVGENVSSQSLFADEVELTSLKAVKDWQPDAVFVPGNMVSNAIPGLKVAVFHGFNAGKINRRGREDHFEIRNCFDLYCTHGPNTTEKFQQLADKSGFFCVAETGWPLTDALFLEQEPPRFKHDGDSRKILLFCSTFSRKYSCAETLYSEVARLSSSPEFNKEWRWLVQFHPMMPEETIAKYKALQNENLLFVEAGDVAPLIRESDVMLCDTSSILIMFLLLGKPVVSFRNQNPGTHLINVDEVDNLEGSLRKVMSGEIDNNEAIAAYIDQLHPYRDGKSSARVIDSVEKILASGLQLRKKKPMNIIREFKERKKFRRVQD